MKTLVLGALISAAAIGNSMANNTMVTSDNGNRTETTYGAIETKSFTDQIMFHRANVDILWAQYEQAEARIRQSRGNHAELESEKAYFISVYQQDIDKGIRVAESKKAIEEIEAVYVEKHAQRDAFENESIAHLQAQLKAALRKEEKKFNSTKKKYAKSANDQTERLIDETAQHFTRSIQRAEKLINETATSVAAI